MTYLTAPGSRPADAKRHDKIKPLSLSTLYRPSENQIGEAF